MRGGCFDARSGGFNFVTHLRGSRRSDCLISNNGVNKRDLRSIDAHQALDRAARRVNRRENGSCIRSDVKDRRWKGGNWINRRRDRLSGMKSGNVCLEREIIRREKFNSPRLIGRRYLAVSFPLYARPRFHGKKVARNDTAHLSIHRRSTISTFGSRIARGIRFGRAVRAKTTARNIRTS